MARALGFGYPQLPAQSYEIEPKMTARKLTLTDY